MPMDNVDKPKLLNDSIKGSYNNTCVLEKLNLTVIVYVFIIEPA